MNYRKQKGVVLLVAIVLLLVITIIGVGAVNSSSIKTQVAGNSMFSMLVYQGAESTLAKTLSSVDIKNIKDLMNSPGNSMNVPAAILPDENIMAGATLTSDATITYEGVFDCPITSGRITSSIVKCRLYKVDANSRIQSTNARSHHIKGVALDWTPSFK